MLSLCRLCADCKEQRELWTQISELESKLILCCGWHPAENETQMPTKVCETCVEQLQQSWLFAESIKAAESKLNKLISELNQAETIETNTSHEVVRSNLIKLEPDICSIEIEESHETFDDDAAAEFSYVESSHAIETVSTESNLKMVKPTTDPFLTHLDDEDRLADGTISVNGVEKLEKLFPEMKAMSWTECEYECQKCNRTFEGLCHFFAHNRSFHIEELQSMVYKCFYCKSKHRREYYLSQHMAIKHFPHLKYRCWYCSDYFWDNRALITHRNQHTNVEYKCELCDRIYTNRDNLYAHIMNIHQNKRWAPDPGTKFTCDICLKDFGAKWSIKNHMSKHSNNFDYICDQCGRGFLTKSNLKAHLQTHSTDKTSQIKPFSCSQCDSRFRRRQQLNNHSKIHEEFKQFECLVCGKRFRLKYGLEEHMRGHNDISPFSCKYCHRKFRHSSSLRTHERTHTNIKPYECSRCQYRSTNKSNLNKHSRTHSIDLKSKPNQQTLG